MGVRAQPARVLVEFSPAEGILTFFEDVMGLTSMNLIAIVRVVKHHRNAVRLAPPSAQIVCILGRFVSAAKRAGHRSGQCARPLRTLVARERSSRHGQTDELGRKAARRNDASVARLPKSS